MVGVLGGDDDAVMGLDPCHDGVDDCFSLCRPQGSGHKITLHINNNENLADNVLLPQIVGHELG